MLLISGSMSRMRRRMGMRCAALCLLAVTAFAAGTSSDDFYKAIRQRPGIAR